MFYPIYKAIKDRLAAQVTALRDVQLYNNNFENVIHVEPIAYIEFTDPVEIRDISKESERISLSLRVHVVSKVYSDVDGAIKDTAIEDHDEIADSVLASLSGFTPAVTGEKWTMIRAGSFQVVPDHSGWLVTQVNFTVRKQA